MPKVMKAVTVQKPVHEVFEYVDEPMHLPEIWPSLYEVKAVEITPVHSIDDHEIGVGPVTLELQKAYKDTVTGKSERWGQWIDYAPTPKTA